MEQKLHLNQEITKIVFKTAWQQMPLIIYPASLGSVRDLIPLIPELKKFKVIFFLDGARKNSYEEVQILSSLGIYSGIVINEQTDWEKLTDLMNYALCGRIKHAPIEPFQYVFDLYQRNKLVDYGMVYEGSKEECSVSENKSWQKFFYEATPCAACAGWRICLGKYENLEDKTGCCAFSSELLLLIDSIKMKSTH